MKQQIAITSSANAVRLSKKRQLQLSLIALMTAVFILMLVLIYSLNEGHIIYTFDDAYIHLSVAQNIAAGHYGVNSGEISAPSSSIIWPFLLAPFAAASIGQYMPLAINFLLSIGILVIYIDFSYLVFDKITEKRKRSAVLILVLFLVLATNLFGLAFSGMEHSLQLFLAVLVVMGIIREQMTGRVSWWLVGAIILGPLVRYELLALSVPAILYLASRKHIRSALISLIFLLIPLIGFSLFLFSNGLGPVPTSVLVKQRLGPGEINGARIALNFVSNITVLEGALLTAGTLILIFVALFDGDEDKKSIASWAALAGLLHLLAGRVGTFTRYEAYIIATILLVLCYLFQLNIAALMETKSLSKVTVFLGLCLLTLGWPYLRGFFRTPIAANNIYEQQYQMRRFVTEFLKAPIAANDIGWLTYQNDWYVLDIYGLSSWEAFNHSRNDRDPLWMNALAAEQGVKVAMIYDNWFPNKPENWKRVGTLKLGKDLVTVGGSVVSIYALDDQSYDSTAEKLRLFKKTLPAGVQLELE